MSSTTANIRRAGAIDLSEVYRIICALEDDVLDKTSFSEVFTNNLNDSCCFYFIAETDGKIIGFISMHLQQLLHHCGPVGEIQEFYVDSEYRGKGIGRQLMDEVKRYAGAHKVTSLEVTSNKKRTATVPMYESLGFKLTHNKFTL